MEEASNAHSDGAKHGISSFEKQLCPALGLILLSEITFLRFQKHFAAPAVEEVWRDMNNVVKQVRKAYEDICLCGDGQNDSPGHSVSYCVYTLLLQYSHNTSGRMLICQF